MTDEARTIERTEKEMRTASYKAIQIIPPRPERFRDGLIIAWGLDIFIWQVPVLKLMLSLWLLQWLFLV